MTDNEIIKALGQCIGDMNCLECPYVDKDEENKLCSEKLFADVCDLINRQKAEIEKLKADSEMADGYGDALVEYTRDKAIKEFAERLKRKARVLNDWFGVSEDKIVYDCEIDNLVKEMTEDEGK